MSEIIKEILKHIPKDKVSDAVFEGANIVLYTKDKDFFLNDQGLVREVVNLIKKRIELRPDPTLCLKEEKARAHLESLIDKEAGVSNIIFDPMRSLVIIEAEKPGLAIGKQGEALQRIKEETFWVPLVKRTPAIRSQLIENVRSVLYANSDYRRKFLHRTGERIYNGWLRAKKEEWIRLSYLGAGRQVGRSCLLLQTPESRILLDCGIDAGATDADQYPYLEAPEFDINELDAVIIGHAHMDHSGFLPYLIKFGYKGPIYCTEPTRDIMALLQLDMVKIQRTEGREPIYASDEVREVVKNTITLNYEEVTDITPDIRITFYNAGHILGSAMVHIHVGNGLHNLVYSGDLKYGKSNLLSPAHTSFPRVETLLLESTYGGRENVLPSNREADKQLSDIIVSTVKRGGKVLMPVLGVGRAQEMIVLIVNLIRTKMIPDIPVYIDGMVWDITAIHTAYPEFLNATVRQAIFHKDENPFLSPCLRRVGSAAERKKVIEEESACAILATSGMLVGGPSVEYLRAMADNARNTLVFSCYQGENTLGRRVQRGLKELHFQHGQRVETTPLRMELARLEISGHSDRRELMSFIQHCSPRPKKVIVNHGDALRCLDLASSIHKQFRIETIAHRNLEVVRIK